MRSRCSALGLMALAACASMSLAGQQTNSPQSSELVLRTNVRRVVEDVVVTDAQGKPVTGLTRDDFALQEDGKKQRILSFDFHDGSKPDFVPPVLPPLPANTFVDLPNGPEQGPLYIILYDMVNMDLEDQAHSRQPLLDFIDNKPPGTRVAIFLNTDKTRLIQGFTQDRELLRAALHSAGPGPHLPRMFLYGNNYGKANTGATISIFNQLAQYLEGVPGRKNLLWVSASFPIHLSSPSDELISLDEVKQTVGALTRAQIALYPVDVRGVALFDSADGLGRPAGRAAVAVFGGVAQTALDAMNEDQIAKLTGGRAYHGSNDIRALMNEAVDQSASYYTLSYSPSDPKEDGKRRNIEVELAKDGYNLAYRRFYYDLPSDAKPPKPGTLEAVRAAARQNDTLYANVLHGAPMLHDLLFSCHVRAESISPPGVKTRCGSGYPR